MPTVVPFHQAVLNDPAYTAANGRFGVHTRWIETEFAGNLPAYGGVLGESDEPPSLMTVVVEVNGRRLEVRMPAEIGGGKSSSVKKPVRRARGAHKVAEASGNTLASPMQGTIVKVAVAEGDVVSDGDLIVVIEAMKICLLYTSDAADDLLCV